MALGALDHLLGDNSRSSAKVEMFLRGVLHDQEMAIGMSSEIPSDHDYRFVCDVDSYFYVAQNGLPLVSGPMYHLFVRPNFDYAIQKNCGVYWSLPGFSYKEQTSFKLMDTPNLNIFRFADCNVSN